MTELERLTRLYADAGDEELRAAFRMGAKGYRPEAWRVIQAEAARRGSGGGAAGGTRPTVWPEDEAGGWTPGLLVGLVPASVAAVGALRSMVHVGMILSYRGLVLSFRGLVLVPSVIFVFVWFAVALLVDWRRWWPSRRSRS